jgi:hypothetical protein
MKGVIFTELVSYMETVHGVAFADAVISESRLPNDGAFTSVGNYPSQQALTMVEVAARLSGTDGAVLCEDYGAWLFGRFGVLFPTIMANYPTAESLLMHVGSHIHEEVRVLYPDARPPEITAENAGDTMIVRYRSHRPMAHIAYGLIRQCLIDYDEPRIVRWHGSGRADEATFIIAAPDA